MKCCATKSIKRKTVFLISSFRFDLPVAMCEMQNPVHTHLWATLSVSAFIFMFFFFFFFFAGWFLRVPLKATVALSRAR